MTSVPTEAAAEDLRGFTVAVTADRRSEEQAVMLRRLGVEVLQAPSIRTLPDADDDRLRAVTELLVASPPDVLVANTGLGIRSWLAKAAAWGLDDRLLAALAATRIACRGPKAAGAVRSAGLPVWWRSPTEQLSDVARHLLEEGVGGQRVAFQLHGDHRQTLTEPLLAAGAEVIEVPVYRWALPDEGNLVATLIERCCAGEVDAITFTAGPAVRNLLEMAGADGRADELLTALNSTMVVGCVGPVCAAVAEEEGIVASVVPEHWRLGSLVRAVGEALGARRQRYRVGGVRLVVQGSVILVDGEEVELSADQHRLFDSLRSGGSEAEDDKGTVAGLRAALGRAGAAVAPGAAGRYRFAAQPEPEPEPEPIP